jgi:TonB family protein
MQRPIPPDVRNRPARRVFAALSLAAFCALAGAAFAAISLLTQEVLLENDQVRVVRVHYGPLATTGMHDDPDRVVIPLSDLNILETFANGRTVEFQKSASVPIWQAAARHSIESQGGRPSEAIEVALLGDEENFVHTDARDPSAGDANHFRVLLEEHRVRVLGVRLGAHEKSILVRHTAGVLVALTEAHLNTAGSAELPRRFDLLRGQASWWPAATEAIENTAPASCELVWVELKHVSFPHETSAELSTPRKEGGNSSPNGSGIEILTPTEGVDFAPYVAGVSGNVKRNWFAVMPQTARAGEKGKVVVEFDVLHDGQIRDIKATSNSGGSVLETAALAAVRASSPLEPLPKTFHGPLIKLKCTFLYNTPLERATGP